MDGTTIKELADRIQRPHILSNGLVARPNDWVLVDPAEVIDRGPMAVPLIVQTLGAVRDYLVANRDEVSLDRVVIHVANSASVQILGSLNERTGVRQTYLVAEALDLGVGFLSRFMPLDEFILGLQVRFADADDRAKLLRLLSTVKNESVKTALDDGMTQVVQARAGVALISDVAVPNPVLLAAYRTFRDVIQPSALYVLRLNTGKVGGLPEVGLFEADGGAWRLIATERVRSWFVDSLGEIGGGVEGVAVLG